VVGGEITEAAGLRDKEQKHHLAAISLEKWRDSQG